MAMQMKNFRFNLSRSDCLFTIACIGFLLATLGAVGSAGRRRAKEAVCRSNLRQWGVIFQQFAADNGGYFIDSDNPDAGHFSPRGRWIVFLHTRYKAEPSLLCCPEATELFAPSIIGTPHYAGPFNAYGLGNPTGTPLITKGSYGANCWIYKPSPNDMAGGHIQDRPVEWHWSTPHVKNAQRIPVFSDTMWRGAGPISGDPEEYAPGMGTERSRPPAYDGEWAGATAEMNHVCINRHNGGVNHLFMDWSVRKVGLKELWKLKWHRQFNTNGPWTQAGGIQTRDWPEWMREFKDF